MTDDNGVYSEEIHYELCETETELAESIDLIGFLHTEAYGDRRTYAVKNGKADSTSYAQSIARKYGLIKE